LRILVIGATGFVGSHVARALVRAGHRVTGFARHSSSRDLVADLELEWRIGDLEDSASLHAGVRGHDAVVLCAGELSLSGDHDDRLYRVNVVGARNVVSACLDERVGRLLYDGTAGIYAGSREATPTNELGFHGHERYTSFHVVAMALAEAEILRGVARGLDAVLLHPTLVVGADDRQLHSSWLILGAARARVGLCPDGGINLVAVEDVARAHVLALEKGRSGSVYLIGGENLTNRELFGMLAEVVGNEAPIVTVGARTFEALGTLAGAVMRFLPRNEGDVLRLNGALARAATRYWFVDTSRARAELGWTTSPVRPALERQAEWLRSKGLLSRRDPGRSAAAGMAVGPSVEGKSNFVPAQSLYSLRTFWGTAQ
jgi:dihydroflavonol-4-reductase